jgi:dTDP-4-amino-4,6-dideoxygalactose transaminase
MSINALESKLRQADSKGTLPKIVIPVHFGGQSCDMRAIASLADRYGFRVIEDASHAIGGKYLGVPVGNCRYSSFTIFSFHPVKLITTGEGGMALTNDTALAERMRLLRSHGITREPAMMPQAPDGPWSYQQVDLGYNMRITDIQAALGLSQLSRLDEFVRQRHTIAAEYDRLLSGLPISFLHRDAECYSAFHLYVIRLDSGANGGLRRKVYEHMRAAGIGVNVHYIPVHTQPFYQNLGFRRGDFPEAEKYYKEALTLPMFPGLGELDQSRVLEALQAALA